MNDLVDGMHLSEKWGEQNFNLGGHSRLCQDRIEALLADGSGAMFVFNSP